jgi:NTE family protein
MEADGVFSGGGIKGLAFAGALQATADAGYDKWVSLAGTSAGAITAMALAVDYNAAELRQQLENFDFSKIADYGPGGELEIPLNLLRYKGATHGKVLYEWIEQLLAEAPDKVTTFGELEALGKHELQVVGVDLAHTRMVVFPQDVALYVDENDKPLVPKEFRIADAVRISAGFPYFFPPRSMRDAQTGKEGVMVDGGVASAYPIFLFDKEKPKHPTWGFRLFEGNPPEKPSYTEIDGLNWPIEMLKAIVNTSMNALDQLELKAFAPRTIAIPTGDIETLDFSLDKEQQEALYNFGFNAAKEFFEKKPDGRNTFGSVPPSAPSP